MFMGKRTHYMLTAIAALLLIHSFTIAQTVTTCVGLVLKTDSTDNVLMPRIVRIISNSAADAEPGIKEGMYVLKVNNTYCRNTPLDNAIRYINDREGTPVSRTISDSKDVFPAFAYTLKRGPSLPDDKAPDKQ
jgi:C-terminal processing protease CtpA/Prc